jgi:hypothetical protein
MEKMGYNQGDMNPHVKDYQPSEREFAEKQPGKTTEYISRRDREQNEVAGKLRSENYRGRYE